jgi:hypothetical protein
VVPCARKAPLLLCAGFHYVSSFVVGEASDKGRGRMASSGLIRWGAISLMLGGVMWLLLGFLATIGFLQEIPGREDVVLFIVALLFTEAGLVGLHTLQKGSFGLLGQVGFYIALVAIAARILGAGLFLAGSSAFKGFSLPVATLGMLVGFVLYGVATLRARVLPRWYGLALIASMPVSLYLAVYYGTVLFGLILVALGYVLWLRRGVATEQPSRVR